MKGLIIKDFFNMGQQKKILIVLAIFYGIIGVFADTGGTMVSVIVMVCGILSISAFSYDEFAKWDTYALSMPITRKEIVAARYVYCAVLVGGGVVLASVLAVISALFNNGHISIMFTSLEASTAIVLVMLAVILPLCYKFGIEKSRMWMMGIFVFMTLAGIMAPNVMPYLTDKQNISNIAMPQEGAIALAVHMLLVVAVVVYALSFKISTRIYEKKDF